MLMYMMFARFILANFLVWVNWRKGPDLWLKIAPTFMYILSLCNYILFPLGSFVWFGLNWQNMGKTVYGVYEQTVAIIWLLQIIFYYRIIRPFIYANSMAYIAKRKEYMENKAVDDIDQDELSSNVSANFGNPNVNDSGGSSSKDKIIGPNDEQAALYGGDQGGQFSYAAGGLTQYQDPLYASDKSASLTKEDDEVKEEDSWYDENDC